MGTLSCLEPKNVFRRFEELCAIPHGSGNLDAIAQYCVDFAGAHGLKWHRDAANNVIIRKDASPGCEGAEPLILQGHLDMVCEAEAGLSFDFRKSGVIPQTDGKTVWARGTTLGGDDGIAVAMMLALLEEPGLRHPPLEILLTADEEVGMDGAFALDCSRLRGRRMINLDSEDEGILTCSCAGGVDAAISCPAERKEVGGTALCIELSGLAGGHSGADIHKGGANANALMARLLNSLREVCAFHLAELAGGSRSNVIPITARAVAVLKPQDAERAEKRARACWDDLKSEYASTDPDMRMALSRSPAFSGPALTEADSVRATDLLLALPHGVQAMSADLAGLVQTSCNLAIVRLEADRLKIVSSIRSSVVSQKKRVLDALTAIARLAGGRVECSGDYPGWRYDPDSRLREIISAAYRRTAGKEAVVEAIHAGLECGLFADRIRGLDCVSIGPDMRNVHTPSEFLDVRSCERFYTLLKEILSACASG